MAARAQFVSLISTVLLQSRIAKAVTPPTVTRPREPSRIRLEGECGLMVQAFALSEAGGHPVNEDAYAVRQHASDPDCWICVLADGQCGQCGGGHALQLACEMVMELAEQQPSGQI